MNKKTVWIIILMVLIAGGLIFAVRWIVSTRTKSNLQEMADNQNTYIAGTLPRSTNPGVQSWSGTLGLGQTVTLNTGSKIYTLFINGGATTLLTQQGYKTGDKIIIMGRLKNNVIEVVGVSSGVK